MNENAATAIQHAAPLLRIEGVAKAYGETRALKTCDLAIRGGSIHAVIGENGSGKSTMV
jgi:rhamnose transport system ATP-binding protein